MHLQSRAIAVLTAAIALSASLAPVAAADAPVRTAKDIIDAAPASDWRDLDPANTLYMQLDSGLVVMELAPGIARRSTWPTSARWPRDGSGTA